MKKFAIVIAIGFLFVTLAQAESYDRKKHFGDGWADLDNDGLNTREELIEKNILFPGKVLCEYTGEIHALKDIHADHVIPLSWAWQYGANQWNQEQRIAFANDESLIVLVYAPVNQAKGNKDYSEWVPPRIRFIPEYLLLWKVGCEKYNLPCDYNYINILVHKYINKQNGIRP